MDFSELKTHTETVPTDWTLYTNAEEAWEAMLTACKEAKYSIDLEQFIFVPDEIGKKFIEVCAEKVKQGVRVRFMWDSAGSFSLFSSYLADDIRKKGIDIVFFGKLVPNFLRILNYRLLFFRNHRRSLIIDGSTNGGTAFTGSICVSDRMRNWRETNMKISGDTVIEISRAFDLLWLRAQGKKSKALLNASLGVMRSKKDLRTLISHDGFNYITNSPRPRQRFLYYRLIEAIQSAQKNIYITTPYFAPTHKLLRVLRLAGLRGVDVRILLPQKSDHPIVDLCGRSYFSTLLRSGIKIFLYNGEDGAGNGRMIHTKTVAIDGTWATIGTLNMDTISLLYNYEGNIVSTNQDFIQEVVWHFEKDISESTQVDQATWNKRFFIKKVLEMSSRIMRKFL